MRKLMPIASLLCLFSFVKAQISNQYNPSSSNRATFIAKKLYTMKHLEMNPTSVQLLKNPIFSSKNIPHYDMVMLSYYPSQIKYIPDVGKHFNGTFEKMRSETKIVTDENILSYPNSVGVLPQATIDKQPKYVWWIATGMFGKESGFTSNEGNIYLLDMTTDRWEPVSIYKQKHAGFSHVEWFDMDLDKKKDCITIQGSFNRAKLIWLRQPRSASGSWTPQPISNVTDVGGNDFRVMRVKRLNSKKKIMLIIVAGRRNGHLTAYWVNDPDNDWTQTSQIRSVDIAGGTPDLLSDSFVNVEIVDLNDDGIPEILTSVAAFANTPGRIVSFQLPKGGFDPQKPWRRRTLFEFPVTATNYGLIFPGPASVFYVPRSSSQATKKPHILISGASKGDVYVLRPTSWSPRIWTYDIQTIHSSATSAGIPYAIDGDGDGKVEILVPSGKHISIFKYMLSSSSERLVWNSVVLAAATVFAIFCDHFPTCLFNDCRL